MTGTLDAAIATELLRVAPCGVVVLSAEGRIEWHNPAAERLLGLKSNELLGRALDDLQSRLMDPTADDHLFRVNRAEGGAVYIEMALQKLGTRVAAILTDATSLLQAQEECQSLASQLREKDPADPLTGMMNRRALLQAFGSQVSRSRRYHNPLSVIALELAEGAHASTDIDKALVSISQYLRDQLRWVDLIGRTGNEQFTLVLPETGKEDALKLATKLEERLNELPLSGSESVKIKAVMGVAAWNKGDDVSILLKRLDQALTAARDRGAPAVEYR
ncbi:MAG: sensor domain-containing diguanylate cyclase [Pseudomonadota bacterium]